MISMSGAADAAISWKRVGTVTTLTNNQLCTNDGTSIFCDTTTPTVSSGLVGIGSLSPITSLDLSQRTDAIALPVGSSGTRPTGTSLTNGEIRYNSSTPGVEAYVGGAWMALLGGAGGILGTGNGGTGTGTTFTQGSVLFAGASGIYSQDNAQFFWDDTNHRLGIGSAVPAQSLVVVGSETVSGYLRVGSNSAPTNTTAGDLTVTRMNVGNAAFSGTGFMAAQGTVTDSTGTVSAINFQPVFTPSAANTGQLHGLNVNTVWTGTNSITLGYSSNYDNDFRLSGSAGVTNAIIGFAGHGMTLNGNANNFGTVNQAMGAQVEAVDSFGNSVTGTITHAIGLAVSDSTTTTQTITYQAGVYIAPLSAATNNTAVLIGTTIPSAGNYGIYNASANNNYFAGNVGIGTINPSVGLQVQADNGGGWAAFFSHSATANGVLFGTNGGTAAIQGATSGLAVAALALEPGGGRVGIGTAAPTNILSLVGSSAQTFWMERGTSVGNNLTVQAGGGVAAGTNENGGNLILASGISTGTGTSSMSFNIYKAGSTGTADNSATTALTITGAGNVGIGTAGPNGTLEIRPATNETILFRGPIVAASGASITANNDTNSSYVPLELEGSITVLNAANTAGAVGIGTATMSSSNKLEVNGAASIGYPDTYGGSAGGLIVSGNVGIGTSSPNTNALLQIYSTTKGFLPPLLTTAQETAMGTSLPTGLIVYNTDSGRNELESWNGISWEAVGANAEDAGGSNTQLQYNNSGDLGGTAGLTWDSTNDALTLATFSNPAASALTIAGGALTGTTSYPALNVTQTWNNAGGTFTGILENVTNSASVGTNASKLLDLQVSGASKFNVNATGQVTVGSGMSNGTWSLTSGGSVTAGGASSIGFSTRAKMTSAADGALTISNSAITNSTTLSIPTSNVLQLGAADAAAPVAQTLGVQNVVVGTSNTAGADFTITGSQGTGTGAGGNIVFKTAPASGSSGTTQNVEAEAVRITSTGQVGIGSASPATGMKADINGPVKVAGTGSEACSAATVGAMRYNPTGQYMEICTYP